MIVSVNKGSSGCGWLRGGPAPASRCTACRAITNAPLADRAALRPEPASTCSRASSTDIAPETAGARLDALDRLDAGTADAEALTLIGEAEALAMADPRYARLAAMQLKWAPALQWFALKRMLRGWDRLPLAFAKGPDGLVPDALLDGLPQRHLAALGVKALGLMAPSEDEAKN